jgi:Rho termination factor, N-terminal domain.
MKETILTKGKLYYGGKLYNKGDAIPESVTSRNLIKGKCAEVVDSDEETTESGDGYERMTVAALTKLAKERNLDIPERARKDDLITLLRAKDQLDADEGVS